MRGNCDKSFGGDVVRRDMLTYLNALESALFQCKDSLIASAAVDAALAVYEDQHD